MTSENCGEIDAFREIISWRVIIYIPELKMIVLEILKRL